MVPGGRKVGDYGRGDGGDGGVRDCAGEGLGLRARGTTFPGFGRALKTSWSNTRT